MAEGAGPHRVAAAGDMEARGGPIPPAGSALPWGRLAAWLDCVCAVTFDLELGQAIEVGGEDSPKTSICYLSFPDSYSGSLGDTQFSFRFRRSGGQRSALFGDYFEYNREVPVSLQRESAYYFGYVYFRQVKDSSMKRGYFQKSLVLVSRLPFVNLFQSLLQLIAPEYFDKLDPCLEAVCSEIDQWPPPVPGQMLSLPVMGVVIQVRPSRHSRSVLIHVQTLWELMLLGEPVVVMAPSPAASSEMVLALTSCLAPLKYCCDYRPYFTIHDSEFKEYTTRTQAPPPLASLPLPQEGLDGGLPHRPTLVTVEPGPAHAVCLLAGDLPKQVKMKKPAKLKSLEAKPGLYTSYKTYLQKDKTLIKRLLKGIHKKRSSEALSALLRCHLLELTQSFIIPLEQYLASLMPLRRTISPWKNPPQIRPFHQEDFLKTLEHAGPQLTCMLKGDWMGLYRRFFRSPNFDGWYRQRHREMVRKLEALHLEAICEANIRAWMKDKSEVEVVDLILKLREELMRARCHLLPVKEETLQRVDQYITTIVGSLPEDLQAVLCHQ
uniref:DENN domain containing 6B n=1 Tax=Varanus komodoensis TaxID=61221 RepID=A0A8D2LW73_VARKO